MRAWSVACTVSMDGGVGSGPFHRHRWQWRWSLVPLAYAVALCHRPHIMLTLRALCTQSGECGAHLSAPRLFRLVCPLDCVPLVGLRGGSFQHPRQFWHELDFPWRGAFACPPCVFCVMRHSDRVSACSFLARHALTRRFAAFSFPMALTRQLMAHSTAAVAEPCCPHCVLLLPLSVVTVPRYCAERRVVLAVDRARQLAPAHGWRAGAIAT